MQLHDLVDLLFEHLQAALPQLSLGCICDLKRIGAHSWALHACRADHNYLLGRKFYKGIKYRCMNLTSRSLSQVVPYQVLTSALQQSQSQVLGVSHQETSRG